METLPPTPIPADTAAPPDLIERGATLLERALAAALIAAVLINVINVAARYLFGESITGVDELQIYLLEALAFFGSVVAVARRQHLRMDVLTRYFPNLMNRALVALEAVGAVLLCGFVCWISTQYMVRMQQLGSVSENAHIPMWIPHAVVAIAFAAMTLIGAIRLVDTLLHPHAALPAPAHHHIDEVLS